jgi:hypothetical protein
MRESILVEKMDTRLRGYDNFMAIKTENDPGCPGRFQAKLLSCGRDELRNLNFSRVCRVRPLTAFRPGGDTTASCFLKVFNQSLR